MTDRREVVLTYFVLGCFSLLSLVPIVAILVTAVQDPGGSASVGRPDGLHLGNFATAWDEGHFGSYLKSSAIVAACVGWWCSCSWWWCSWSCGCSCPWWWWCP